MPRLRANLKRPSIWRSGINEIMKNGGLAPYILISIVIHAGALFGAYQFLKLPTEESESIESIRVEVAVMREESPAIEPELTPGERIWPEKTLQAKSLTLMKTSQGPSAVAIAKPLPRAIGEDPRVTIAGGVTTTLIAETPVGEDIGSKPMHPSLKTSPAPVSPVYPSPGAETAPLAVKMPAALMEAKAANSPVPSQVPQKIETPLTGRLPREASGAVNRPAPRQSASEPELMVATLQLSSRPSGAQVFVDDLLSGVTPLDVELPIGKHEVRLALPKYYDWQAQIELTAKNQVQPIFFRLLPVENAN